MVIHMFNNFKKLFKNLDPKTIKIMKLGFTFCFLILIFSLLFLISYLTFKPTLFFFLLGITLLKLSIIFSIEFIICGIIVDIIKKKLI